MSYVSDKSEPISIFVDSFNSAINEMNDHDLVKIIEDNFDMRLESIIKDLDLKRGIYKKTVKLGSFG